MTDFYPGGFYGTTPNELELLVDRTIQELQHAFDLQKATPLDLIFVDTGVSYSLFDVGTTPFRSHTFLSHK